jgi:hypothetical protein
LAGEETFTIIFCSKLLVDSELQLEKTISVIAKYSNMTLDNAYS